MLWRSLVISIISLSLLSCGIVGQRREGSKQRVTQKQVSLKEGGEALIEAMQRIERSPRDVVATFLSAIYLKEYGVAYGYLSSDTKKLFEPIGGLKKFEEMMSKLFPHLDLGLTLEEVVDSNSALVSCRLFEDPASMGFKLVKEKGEWKLVLGLSKDGLEIRYP